MPELARIDPTARPERGTGLRRPRRAKGPQGLGKHTPTLAGAGAERGALAGPAGPPPDGPTAAGRAGRHTPPDR